MGDINLKPEAGYLDHRDLDGIVENVFRFLEYYPSTRRPEVFMPPRLDDLSTVCRFSVQWYDDKKRYGHVFHYSELEPPDELWFKRQVTYAAVLSFVPWGKWQHNLEQIYKKSPEEDDFMDALSTWLLPKTTTEVDEISECHDDDIEDAIYSLGMARKEMAERITWARKLIAELEFTRALGEVSLFALHDQKKERDSEAETLLPDDSVPS